MCDFKVGDLATRHGWSDSHAGRIVEVRKNGREVLFQEDKAELLNSSGSGEPDALKFSPGGFVGHTSGTQRWKCEVNTDGATYRFSRRLTKAGAVRWKLVGQSTRAPGGTLSPGQHHYYDFNF